MDSNVVRMSTSETKKIDKSQITQLTLDDGTVIDVEDNNNPLSQQKVTTSTTNFNTQNIPPRGSTDYVKEEGNPKRESFGRIIEDQDNYRIYESGVRTTKGKNLREMPVKLINMDKPVIFVNQPKTTTRTTRTTRTTNKVRESCPYCDDNRGGILRTGQNKTKEIQVYPVWANKVENKVYTVDIIPNAKPRFIKTVVETTTGDNFYERGETPVFTFKNPNTKKYSYGQYVAPLKSSKSTKSFRSTPKVVETVKTNYCPRCRGNDLCPYCSNPMKYH